MRPTDVPVLVAENDRGHIEHPIRPGVDVGDVVARLVPWMGDNATWWVENNNDPPVHPRRVVATQKEQQVNRWPTPPTTEGSPRPSKEGLT